MKKYILPTFIVFFVVATTIFFYPQIFLNGDAKWTYQNDMAQIGISIQNATSDDTIKLMGGGNSKTTEHPWPLDENLNQLTLHIPVTYSLQSYHFTIKPQTKNLSKKIALNFQFKAKDFYVNNHIKSAWVRFKNIQINGKNISKNAKVNYQEPFEYSLENISPDEEIQLDFEIKKPLSINHFSFLPFGLILLLIILLVHLRKTLELFKKFNEIDLPQVILKGYHNINPVYKKSFWIIFGILCFAFGFHTICYMWGNHDWSFLVFPFKWDDAQPIGRYTLHLFKALLFKGIYLPIIYDLLSFLCLALNGVLLCFYWRLEKRLLYFVLCGLILTIQPFLLDLIYYVHMIPETFIGVTFILIAFILSEKIGSGEIKIHKKRLCFLSVVLINMALAMYPVLINTIAVAFLGRLLIQSFSWDGTYRQFKACFKPFYISVINIVLGILSYKLIVSYVWHMHSLYNTQTISLQELPERVFMLIKQSFYQLYEYPAPFISQFCLWIFGGFMIVLVLHICFAGNLKQRILRLLLLFASLFATQTAMLIAASHIIDGRIEAFGLVVYETLVAVLVFTKLRNINNLSIIAFVYVIFVSIINDLDCLHTWKLGFDAEKMLWNRVLMRLEMQKEFNPLKKYKIIQVGDSVSLRKRYYAQKQEKLKNAGLIGHSYDANWDLFHAHEFYYPTAFRDKLRFWPNTIDNGGYKRQLKRLYDAGILNKAKAWPDKNGLIVWKDIILYITDEKILEDYKKQLQEEYGAKNAG